MMLRHLTLGFSISALVLGLGLGAGILYLRSALPDYSGERELEGLGAPVEVWRDSLGVPQIWAGSTDDLYFAQGYLHAQDRLWQMEVMRRVAAGRLAEVLGEEMLESDRFLRTLGLGRAARAGLATLDSAEYSWLAAYAAGVNGWLSSHRGALPPEFLILRFRPEPWEIEHSLMLEKIMAWDLASYQRSLYLHDAALRLGPERVRHLAPDYPEWGARVLGSASTDERSTSSTPRIPGLAAELLGAFSIANASNAWAISGSRTSSHKPILANDMHLALSAPGLWYLTAQHSPELEVAGLTLPGAPFVVAGHNRAIAWGLTNAYLDDADLFIERLDPQDPARYLVPGGSLEFDLVHDTIRVRGREAPVIVPIRLTRHGPVITDVEERAGGELLALRWAGHDAARTWSAFPALNRARNWAEFTSAVHDFQNPHQNLVYADTAGHIGYRMGGRIPRRGQGRIPPLLPVPGWTGEWEWDGYLPPDEHPSLLDPPEGYLVTANNRQVAGGLGDLISGHWEEPFRAERIRTLLEESDTLDASAAHLHQLDQFDAMAARYRDLAVAAAELAGRGEVARTLRDWDLVADPDSRGAAIFYTWHDRLREGAAHSLYRSGGQVERAEAAARSIGRSVPGDLLWFPRDAVTNILERRALPWVEDGGSREFEELSVRALVEADSIVGGRSWGEVQVVVAEHPMSRVGLIRRLLRLDMGPEPFGGSPTTVNVAGRPDLGGGRRRVTHAASQRHLVDLGDRNAAGGYIIPTGQSGIPFSRHYRDQFERWRVGGLWEIPLDRGRAGERTVYRQRLVPATRSSGAR